MSRSTVIGIIAACFAGGLLIGIYQAPRFMADSAVHDAAKEAMRPTIQSVAQDAIKEEARKAAQSLADKIVREKDQGVVITQSAPAGTLSDAANAVAGSEWKKPAGVGSGSTPVVAPVAVERDAFSLVAPPGSTVDADSGDLGREHLVGVHMPDLGSIHIVVLNDPSQEKEKADQAIQDLRGKVVNAKDFPGGVLSWSNFTHVNAIRGTIDGVPFGFETATLEGARKACLVIVQYRLPADSEKSEVMTRMHQVLTTMKMKP
jgi:Flp pilus assembly protein TadG